MVLQCTLQYTKTGNITEVGSHQIPITAQPVDGRKVKMCRYDYRLTKQKNHHKFWRSHLTVFYTDKQKVLNMAADGRSLAGCSTSLGAEVLDTLLD
jgi:hypothetical protein